MGKAARIKKQRDEPFSREPKRPTAKYIPKDEARKARRASEQRFDRILQDAAAVVRREHLDELEDKA